MTDTSDSPADASAPAPKKRSGGLSSMLLADLRAMASGMGIDGAGSMKKAQIVEAIKSAQAGPRAAAPSARAAKDEAPAPATEVTPSASVEAREPRREDRPADPPPEGRSAKAAATASGGSAPARGEADRRPQKGDADAQSPRSGQRAPQNQGEKAPGGQDQADKNQADKNQADKNQADKNQADKNQADKNQADKNQADKNQAGPHKQGAPQDDLGDDEGRTGRNRRRRGRDRTRAGSPAAGPGGGAGGGPQRNEPDTTVLEDDVLVPAGGILDVLDNYAFVRTSGYLPGVDDVYLSLSMVRKFGLRRGDAIVGQVRQPREGERKEKFNPMVRIDTVNGADPQHAGGRADFDKLTPLNPSDRLRMETGPGNVIGRVIDLTAPIGKGQRGLIVAPAKAGKTMVLKSIAASVTANNPECHLMVVLVDERPEEITEFERSVKGEVIASAFDRPPGDHTIMAELAIERAKRLVELGHDVVVLLDGITRLGRAYNLSMPASGRILSGGVDAGALHPPKRFFGAARNIENGGSLTIIATALVESGSRMDEVILEEFNGTDNMELRLRRDLADRRVFPAVDPVASGTRREELLMSDEEVAIMTKLRRQLAAVGAGTAAEQLLERLSATQTNIEFLMKVQKSTPRSTGVE